MSYRRILVLTDLGHGQAALRRIRRLAPAAEMLAVLVYLAPRQITWCAETAPARSRRALTASLQSLRESAARVAPKVELRLIGALPADALARYLEAEKFDLVAVGAVSPVLLPVVRQLQRQSTVPVMSPAGRLVSRGAKADRRLLDLPDVINMAGTLRVRIDYAGLVGRREPIPDQKIAFLADNQVVATATTRDGYAELGTCGAKLRLGVSRQGLTNGAIRPPAVEARFSVIHSEARPLLLFPAELPDTDFLAIAERTRPATNRGAIDLLAVRMRANKSCRRLRARLRAAGLPVRVADASAILNEGDALDVGDTLDAVRLARVAARMRHAGFPVVAIIYHASLMPATSGFVAVRPHELLAEHWSAPAAPVIATPPLDVLAPPVSGNCVQIELDNVTARRWLLDSIGQSRERVHVQVYMAADDDVGKQVEAALAAAASRGVSIRLLVDSVHGRHGSFGVRNPLLERLSVIPGVELRLANTVGGAPSVELLKQRDHRKVAVIDNSVAIVGGRNLSHEYFTGFDEVALTAASSWREVPWLDAGARVEGPAVAAIEQSFLDAWTAAGGSSFDVLTRPDAGSTQLRVVVHRGLRDAATLETYLALIDAAESHILVVNGFPLMLEIQHALLRALKRGVRVGVLVGHLTPRYGGKPFRGPWSAARTAATQFVHSRVDSLAAAGGEVYQFVVAEQPSWSKGLGAVYPHVHAKVVSVDGRVCAVGSANLDFTAGYWENEMMILIEDSTAAGQLEAHIERLFAGSRRVDPHDPAWQRLAWQRKWMRRWPGALSV